MRGRARSGGSEWHGGSKNGLSHFQAVRFASVWVEVGHILWMKGYYGRPVMLPARRLQTGAAGPVAAAATADIIMRRAPLIPPPQTRGGTRWDQRRGKGPDRIFPAIGVSLA
jgi:hypothetical protein